MSCGLFYNISYSYSIYENIFCILFSLVNMESTVFVQFSSSSQTANRVAQSAGAVEYASAEG